MPAPVSRPSPGLRRAWKVVGSLVAVPLLLFGGMQVASALAHERRTEVTEVDATALGTVEIRNVGAIRVVGVDGADTVVVNARISDGWRETGHSVRRDGDRLVVRGTCPVILSTWCDVSYTVEVPAGLAVVADGSNGRVTVTDVDADVHASSDNGRVEVARVEGDVRADSDNGSVTVTDVRAGRVAASSDNGGVTVELVDPPRDVFAESDNGDVEVVLPEGGELYRVVAETDNGSVSTPVRQDPASDRMVTATSDNGDVTVTYALGG